ncbi:hypothetical protein evm_007362 [Chilo suppressalis]|nr:hypothetical protein evm_007362 [Chilo suppressalis]
MKESYPDDIMLCFVQGFGDGEQYKNRVDECEKEPNLRLSKKRQNGKRVSLPVADEQSVELRPKKCEALVTGKSLRLSSGELSNTQEVKRSFSDRFSVITDVSGRRPPRRLLTIRKTWSTGNFASGAAGGGCGAPRSAPATPFQLEPQPRTKHEKQVLKPLSGSAPSVRVSALTPAGGPHTDTSDGKQPSKARQKKFQRHFPQVGPEEKVLNYYSCALVGDLLLQGHLYITKNYFAFYSNVFGYVTKLLIPTPSVLRITKEKVARIIPNAVGVCTRDERHVFGSLLSRDSTYKLMMHVWKAARAPELATPKPQDLRASEVELDASEYSPEDDSSSAGGDHVDAATATVRRESEAIIAAEESYNKQSDKVYAYSSEEANNRIPRVERGHFPSSLMVWLGVCYWGLTESEEHTRLRKSERNRLHPARRLALLQSRFDSVRLQDMATLGGKGVLKASSQFGVAQDILD